MINHIRKIFNSYPSTTKIIVSGVLFSASDYITQIVFQKIPFDSQRNIIFLICGVLYYGPSLQIWYTHLLPKISNKLFSNSSKIRRVFGCLLFDELLFGPILFSGYYIVRQFIKNPSIEGLQKGYIQLKDKIIDTILADWSVWPIANSINFYFVPIKYQALYVSFVTFFFNILFSYVSNRNKKKQQ